MCSASSTKTSSTPARTRCSAALRPERPPPMIRIWTSGCMGSLPNSGLWKVPMRRTYFRRSSNRRDRQPLESDARVVVAAAQELGAAQLARRSVHADFIDAAFLPALRGHQQVGRLRLCRAVGKKDRAGTVEGEFPGGFRRIADLLAV